MKKLLIAVALTFASLTAQASPAIASKQDCDDYADIVGSMQDIRNGGGTLNQAKSQLSNLVNSTDRDSREFGRSLTVIAESIWSDPAGWPRENAVRLGLSLCNKHYRK